MQNSPQNKRQLPDRNTIREYPLEVQKKLCYQTNYCTLIFRPCHTYLKSDADDFIITERLGSGTFGEAFLAKNISSNEQFVIKIFKYEVMKRRKMIREIAILQHLCGHPNIVRLFHVVKQSLFGYPALVFESINNVDHEELYPNLSTTDIQYYAYELLKGIAFAHSRGIIHKDIKPSNVMIDHDLGILKIIDWGISDYYKPGKKAKNKNIHKLVGIHDTLTQFGLL